MTAQPRPTHGAPTADNPARSTDRRLAQLTLAEKASLLSGADFWTTQAISRPADGIEIPGITLADGPHGIRKQAETADHLGIGGSVPATCFPTAAALGSTWDRDLVRRVGQALGDEAAAQGVGVLLGPGVNIKRSPLCGRNFEYLSEDPVLSARLGAALVDGIQSRGVGASLKHFAANNQETDRMRISADVDERTLREIYLPAFEYVVRQCAPWTVMCSYNRVNGVHASQDHWLLTDILRKEWGFDGVVVSDWGAVRDRVAALEAGLDLDMPGSRGRADARVVDAVVSGQLDEALVDQSAQRLLALVDRAEQRPQPEPFDAAAHHALARTAAAAGCVLLRNEPVEDDPLLPLVRTQSHAVIGAFAATPRYQGAGSSQVNPTMIDDALSALRTALDGSVSFAEGFTVEGGPEGDDAVLAAQALAVAESCETVVLFLGLPAPWESEGYDRSSIDLPANQTRLLDQILAVNQRVIVVLAGGGVIRVTPWAAQVPAIVEAWLGGQASGSGVADILVGAVCPSGRLAETMPLELTHTPAFGNFPGSFGHVRYGEGLLVGYRWYDARQADVAYPFGHGLSYTTFAYGEPTVSIEGVGSDSHGVLQVDVTNTGARAGADVVQVYVGDPGAAVPRPPQELVAFDKVYLEPGQSQTVTLALDARSLAYWHPVLRRWVVGGGTYTISVGASSRDIRGSLTVEVAGDDLTLPLHRLSSIGEVLDHPTAGPVARQSMAAVLESGRLDPASSAILRSAPIGALVDLGILAIQEQDLERILAAS